jgi:hypothetical protein
VLKYVRVGIALSGIFVIAVNFSNKVVFHQLMQLSRMTLQATLHSCHVAQTIWSPCSVMKTVSIQEMNLWKTVEGKHVISCGACECTSSSHCESTADWLQIDTGGLPMYETYSSILIIVFIYSCTEAVGSVSFADVQRSHSFPSLYYMWGFPNHVTYARAKDP